jgi:hypothetical protein
MQAGSSPGSVRGGLATGDLGFRLSPRGASMARHETPRCSSVSSRGPSGVSNSVTRRISPTHPARRHRMTRLSSVDRMAGKDMAGTEPEGYLVPDLVPDSPDFREPSMS